MSINPLLCASTGPIASPSGFILQAVSNASTEWTHRTRAACTGCSAPAACRRGCRHSRVGLRSPPCFVAPSAYPRDIHASSELADGLTLDATPAWWAARRRRTRCLRRDLTGSFRLEPVTILAAIVESFSTPKSGDVAGAVCGGSSGRGARTGAGAKCVSACAVWLLAPVRERMGGECLCPSMGTPWTASRTLQP